MNWIRLTLFGAFAALFFLAQAGCFDWDVPEDYTPITDGDGDVDGDGDADGVGQGGECFDVQACRDGYQCNNLETATTPVCRQHCGASGDCAAHGSNSFCVRLLNETSVCTIDCELPEPYLGCEGNTHCIPIAVDGSATSGTACAYEIGSGITGDPCTTYSDCAMGFACLEASGTCTEWCFDSFECPGECLILGDLNDGRQYGVCDDFGA